MTSTATCPVPPAPSSSVSSITRRHARLRSLWNTIQLVLCLVLTGATLVYLLWSPDHGSRASAGDQPAVPAVQAVRLTDDGGISVKPDCPLAERLHVTTVHARTVRTPVLMVTGTVTASLRPGHGKGNDYWQFNSSELLTTFTDWQKATADIAFAQTQLVAIRQLAETRITAQQALVQRMKKLVEAGTDTEKDLAASQADLIQSQIQGRKDIHEAETTARLAQRTEAAQARQLQQAGLEPTLLQSIAADIDIVVADVPEGLMSRVKLGQGCEARFFSFPDEPFSGKVRAISPVLSKERRSLRVLFAIQDPQDKLRPGMFADIGLGTDARDALLIPAEGIIHVGRSDYVLVRAAEGIWRVTEVQVGELHDADVELLSGVRAGDSVAERGVILLKPYMIQVLQARAAKRGGRS